MNGILRNPHPDERPELLKIWQTAFGDSGGEIENFFDRYFNSEICAAVQADGENLCAAGYLLPVGKLVCGEYSISCAMIYAVATLTQYRRRGFAKAITRALVDIAHAKGYPAVVLCPSEDGLFDYYAAHTGMQDFFYVRECVFSDSCTGADKPTLTEITAVKYREIREALLSDVPRVSLDLRAISHQSFLCSETGGGLFTFEDFPSCAAVELSDSEAVVKELLVPPGHEARAAAAIADRFESAAVRIRTPAKSGLGSDSRRFGMLCAPPELLDTAGEYAPWYGFAFD